MWVPQQKGLNGEQSRMLHTMFEHQETPKVPLENVFPWERVRLLLNIPLVGILLKRKLDLQETYWLTKIQKS